MCHRLQATHGFAQPERAASPAESGTAGAGEGEEAPPGPSQYLFQEGEDPEEGQLVSIRFRAPKAGKRQAMLYILCDSWIGADRAVPLRYKVSEQTRAEQEGRTFRGKATPVDGEEEEQALVEGHDSDAGEEDSEVRGGGLFNRRWADVCARMGRGTARRATRRRAARRRRSKGTRARRSRTKRRSCIV